MGIALNPCICGLEFRGYCVFVDLSSVGIGQRLQVLAKGLSGYDGSCWREGVGVQPRNRTYTNRVRVGEWVRAGAPVRAIALWSAAVRCCLVGSWSTGVLVHWITGALGAWSTGARGAPLRVRPLSYRPPAGLTWQGVLYVTPGCESFTHEAD